MKIKVTDLWKYKGHNVMVQDGFDIPKGLYKMIELTTDQSPGLLDSNNRVQYMETFTDEDEVTLMATTLEEQLENLVAGYGSIMIDLIAEDWTEDPTSNFDITPYKHKFKAYSNMLRETQQRQVNIS